MKLEFLTRLEFLPALRSKFLPVSNLLNKYRNLLNGKEKEAKNLMEESEFIQTKILPEVFSAISRLDSSEFDKLIETLLKFVLVDWAKEQCFVSIQILGQIFGYISSVAPKPVVNEFLILFSKHEAPPQVKFYLLPEIAKHLKHPVKQVVIDNTQYHLIMVNKMSQLRASVTAVDAKCIHPFWLSIQYKWTDTIASSLLPVCIQMVDIIPNVKKAMTIQFKDKDNVPIHTLLSVAILILGFRKFNYSPHDTEWGEITKLSTTILEQCSRRDVYDSSSFTKELRYFIVRILSAFFSAVDLESEGMLKDVIASVPLIESTFKSNVGVNHQTAGASSKGTISELEQLVTKIKGHAEELSSAEKARVLSIASELERACH